jgi:hypothetical protein
MSDVDSTVSRSADKPDPDPRVTPATPAGGKPAKPGKPTPDFPLFAHAAGVWAKKIRGKLHYFGPWNDPGGALAKYEAEKDDLHAGRTPRQDASGTTVKDVANAFLNAKNEAAKAGELSPRTWADYRSIIDMRVTGLGKGREVDALTPVDFATLKSKLAKRNGPHRMCIVIQVTRLAYCAPRSGRWQRSDGGWHPAYVGWFVKHAAWCPVGEDDGMDWCRADALAELEAAKNSFKTLMTARPNQPDERKTPRWDKENLDLLAAGGYVYHFERVAPALFKLLDAFEDCGLRFTYSAKEKTVRWRWDPV